MMMVVVYTDSCAYKSSVRDPSDLLKSDTMRSINCGGVPLVSSFSEAYRREAFRAFDFSMSMSHSKSTEGQS